MDDSRSAGTGATSGRPRPRASDAQRTAVLEALDAAFTDGRLSSFEHYERTRTATRTRFIDELRPLVADLRGGDADLGLGDPDADESPGSDQTAWPRPRWRRRGVVAGGVVAVLVVAGVAVAASSGPDAEPEPPGPLHTLGGMTRMLDAAEDEFGVQPIDSMSIYGGSAVLLNEDPAAPGTRLTHSFRGEWENTAFSSRTDSPTFRLDDIDASVIVAAIDAAPDQLDIDEDAETSHVSVSADGLGDPEYRITLSEGADGDLGTVTVGVDGEVREVDQP